LPVEHVNIFVGITVLVVWALHLTDVTFVMFTIVRHLILFMGSVGIVTIVSVLIKTVVASCTKKVHFGTRSKVF
jgi:hypothetical protein